jgi:hypothetical protein
LNRGSHFGEVSCCHCHALQLLNATRISLFMHCFHCKLTSLISQALLQAVLDKKERDFTGWFFRYEFLSLPGMSAAQKAQRHFLQCQCQSTTGTGMQEHTSLCSRHWHTGIPGWLFGNQLATHGSPAIKPHLVVDKLKGQQFGKVFCTSQVVQGSCVGPPEP